MSFDCADIEISYSVINLHLVHIVARHLVQCMQAAHTQARVVVDRHSYSVQEHLMPVLRGGPEYVLMRL